MLGEPMDPPRRHLFAYGAGQPVSRFDANGRYWLWTSKDSVASTSTITQLASARLGASSRWPALWHANRFVFGNSQPSLTKAVGIGKCVWIPSEWFRTSTLRAQFARPNAAQCSGKRAPRHMDPSFVRNTIKAQYTMGIGDNQLAFTFKRSQLYGVTWRSMGGNAARPKDPTPEQWATIDRRIASANAEARRWIPSKSTPLPIIGRTVRLVDDPYYSCVSVPIGGGVPQCSWKYPKPTYCLGKYCTVGRYIFGGGGVTPSEWVKAHEYIHVLQYEGLGLDLFNDRYGDAFRRAGMSAGPGNRMESPGYLWEGWTYILGNVEKEPWQVWHAR